MRFRIFILSILSLPLIRPAAADEFSVVAGIYNLAEDGAEFQVNFREAQSHWQYGLRYQKWSETFHDPYTGNVHSKTSDTLMGPVVYYLFQNESRHSAYVGVSLLNWSRTETPLAVAGASASGSTTDLYFGGGYMGRFGEMGYYNAGMFIAPTAEMNTAIAISTTEESGHFDIQLQLGLVW